MWYALGVGGGEVLCGDLVGGSTGAVAGGSVTVGNHGGGCAVVVAGDSDTFGNCGLVIGVADMGLF